MKATYLIQRVRRPVGRPSTNAFGGGLRNGGLSPAAAAALQEIFFFEYMGAAEYECGIIPQVLSKIRRDASRFCFFTLKLSEKTATAGLVFQPNTPVGLWELLSFLEKQASPAKTITDTIFVFCASEQREEISKRILLMAQSELELRCPTFLAEALQGRVATVGWLELDNNFFFTLDPAMAGRFVSLFCPVR